MENNAKETENSVLYRSLKLIREVEMAVAAVYPSDKIKSPIHLSIGQEAVSVGVCSVLSRDDVVFGTYRGHALYLAKGGDLDRMICELYGKATGCAKGKAGSMHLVDVANGMMGTSAIVASTIPTAVGYAYAQRYLCKNILTAVFFGDGAVEEGVFFESLNFAALKKLPLLFVCENNQYAIHTPQRERQANDDIIGRVKSFGIPASRIEGNDLLRIRKQALDYVSWLRSGNAGPAFMECMTYRWREHVGPSEDFDLGYRSKAEAKPWKENDPMERLGAMLDPATRFRIDSEIESVIRRAFEQAESSPFPSLEELCTDLYCLKPFK